MDYTRQTRIFNPENQKSKIRIIGVGCTGSFIALNLAKLGFDNIEVIDFDNVEAENIPNQFYREKDIGKPKVEALREIIKDFTGTEIIINNTKIDKDFIFYHELNEIIILCLDNMKTRKLIYKKVKDIPIMLIDTRMGGEGFQIYTADLTKDNERENLAKRLTASTMETPCGEKSVIYTILSIASETCNIVKMIDKDEAYPTTLKREMKTYKFLGGIKK